MSTISVKAQCIVTDPNGTTATETKRFMIPTKFILNFKLFAELLEQKFPVLNGNKRFYKVWWKDDEGDEVTISSDDELNVAFNSAEDDVLKVYINLDFSIFQLRSVKTSSIKAEKSENSSPTAATASDSNRGNPLLKTKEYARDIPLAQGNIKTPFGETLMASSRQLRKAKTDYYRRSSNDQNTLPISKECVQDSLLVEEASVASSKQLRKVKTDDYKRSSNDQNTLPITKEYVHDSVLAAETSLARSMQLRKAKIDDHRRPSNPKTSACVFPRKECQVETVEENKFASKEDDDEIKALEILVKLRRMGFSNENGWLETVIKDHHCDMESILDYIYLNKYFVPEEDDDEEATRLQ